MEQFLIVCPLVFLAGLIDAIAGGGGLISLPAYMLAGVPAHMALATNKLSSSMGTVVSTARFAKNGFMDFKSALCCAAMALVGSAIGANLALIVSESVIEHMMLIALPIVAFYVLRDKKFGEKERKHQISTKMAFLISLMAALIIGCYDGFYGPGTGTFLLLVLVSIAGYGVQEASGLTKATNLASNVAALVTFIINGKVIYPLGLIAGLFCIAGHYIGAGMVLNNGQKIVRPVIIIVLALLFIKILWP